MTLVAVVVLGVLLVAAPAAGQEIYELATGQASPRDGVLFDADSVRRLVEEIRDARSRAAILETLRAELMAKDEQIKSLETQVEALTRADRARAIEVAVWEALDKRREADEARLLRALELSDRALTRSTQALERSERRIDSLERRQFWAAILGPIGLLAGFLLGVAAP
jgi:chromosome segregation ATPase